MTASKAIELFDNETDNDVSADLKKQWLSELDLKIACELNKGRAELSQTPYLPDSDDSTSLVAPEEFSEIYLVYLKMKMSYMLSEIERYNNSSLIFNRLFYEMSNYISRNHQVETKNSLKVELNNV